MNRRWLAVFSGLVVGSSIATAAWSQTPSRQPTLAERMAALRRGWIGGSNEQADADARAAAPTRQTQGGMPQVSGRSLIPGNFFGGRGRQQPAQRSQSATVPSTSPRIAERPRAGSSPASEQAQGSATLPGLGGSRLPSAANGAPQTGRVPNDDITPIGSGRYSINQPEATAGSGSRYSSSPTRVAEADPPTVRQSPARRPAMHMNPSDLSRELVGSFPTATTDTAAARPPAPAAGNSGEHSPTPAESPLSLPTTDAPTVEGTNDRPTVDMKPSPRFRVAESANDNAGQGGKSNTSPSVRLRSAVDRSAPATSQRPESPSAVHNRKVFGDSAPTAADDPTVLATQQTPVIKTDIHGPRQILVGREATYRVQLTNQGATAAEGLVASIRIPTWADVVDTTTSHGTVQQSQSGGTTGLLEWQIARLEGQASETLDVRLVPRSSRPLELGVTWTIAPVGSRAVVEVQEPKLGISVTGPDEVLFGKPQLFRLTITNPGTGTAERVKIDLLPPGGGQAAVSTHPLGDLPAGASKIVEVELTAREAGKLSVKAHAEADGGLAADGDKEIFCRKPELEVDWRGPEEKYAGTPATYFFRVRNPGTAPAEDVIVHVTLPEGAKFDGGSEGQSFDAQRREISWQVGTLGPGDDYYMELKCTMTAPGANQLKITAATPSGDLSDNKLAETKVVALADLKLEVSDPSGPVAVGDEAIYEIRVKNRGASTAEDVNIVALFSEGIEPDQAEGALYTVADGRVSFRTIEELAAGRQVALRVRAHAVQAGTHVFRAEVLCKDLEIKLAAEETTRFYADDLQSRQGAEQQSAERSQPFEQSTVR